jgi:hypothetical protein
MVEYLGRSLARKCEVRASCVLPCGLISAEHRKGKVVHDHSMSTLLVYVMRCLCMGWNLALPAGLDMREVTSTNS